MEFGSRRLYESTRRTWAVLDLLPDSSENIAGYFAFAIDRRRR